MDYNYSDKYYQNFNKGTNPRTAFNPPKILGETQGKEFLRKVGPRMAGIGRVLSAPTNPVGQVVQSGLLGYGAGSIIDQAATAFPGNKKLSERIADVISPMDGVYDPNSAPDPMYLEAMKRMEQRPVSQELPGGQMVPSTPTPLINPEQKLVNDFASTMNAATGAPMGSIEEEGGISVPPIATQEDRGAIIPMSSPGFKPQFEGQTLGQFLRYEDTPEQATFQSLDPQGRLRQFTAGGQLAPNLAAFEAESADREARIGEPKVGFDTAVLDRAGGATGGMSITDYRNIAKEELGTGASNQAIRARANQLQGEDKRKREELESTKAYREGQLNRAERDAEQRDKEYSLKLKIFEDKQKELSPEDVLVKGNAAMSKLYNNQSLSDEDIPALLSYRALMMKGGGDDPLLALELDESQTKELLYGSHKLYPSFTKEKDIDKKTARNLISKGQDKVFRYGLLVDLRELIGEDISPAGESTSKLPTTIEEMRNLVKIDDLKKQLESASPRNKKSIQRKIDELTGK